MFYLKEILFVALLLVVAVGNLNDLLTDFRHGSEPMHLAGEVAIIAVSLALTLWLLLDVRRQQRELKHLRGELDERPATPPPSPAAVETRRQLGRLIHSQFRAWQLTASEQEVGLLLLKGLSFREIAALRETHEKTVRAQASAIYRKAGVSGRHAFAAWFIEDFL